MSKLRGWRLGFGLVAATLPGGAATAAPNAVPNPIVERYVAVHAALLVDDLGQAQLAGKLLATAAAHHTDLAQAAATLGMAKDLQAARSAFGDASKALITWLAANPDAAKGLFSFQCPMTKTYQKWVQRTEVVQNPYLGKQMPHCGTQVPMAP